MGKCVMQVSKRKYILSVAGLKALCLILILAWHCGVLKAPDLGARCCEIFFVASGFLEGYRHEFEWEYTVAEAWRFVAKKLRAMWPLAATVYVVSLAWSCLEGRVDSLSSAIATSVFYLTMTQAWIPSIALPGWLSGAAWYVSALLFCYFGTPLVAWCVKYIAGEVDKRFGRSGALLVACLMAVGIRIFLDFAAHSIAVPYNVHTSPLVRLFEYAAAYAIGCLYCGVAKDVDKHEKAFWTLAELVVLCTYAALVVVGNSVIWRSIYSVLAMCVVFILAFEGGVVSELLSCKPLMDFSRVEMQVYFLHQLGIRVVLSTPLAVLIEPLPATRLLKVVLSLAVTCVLVEGWRLLSCLVIRLLGGNKR